MGAHTPHPPVDSLTGTWTVERADRGPETTIVGKPGHVWALALRHDETGTPAVARCSALARTTYRAGQQVHGRVVDRYAGPTFRHDRTATRRA